MIGHSEIAALIPHSGNMCLIDRVTRWDAASICCRAVSHRDPANPLVVGGRLGAVCGVEYAAQAMAIHGGLSGAVGERPRAGYLASLRALVLYVERLDELSGDLVIEVERLAGEETEVSYRFSLRHDSVLLLAGRAAVLLAARAA